jgi:hypothetical protein
MIQWFIYLFPFFFVQFGVHSAANLAVNILTNLHLETSGSTKTKALTGTGFAAEALVVVHGFESHLILGTTSLRLTRLPPRALSCSPWLLRSPMADCDIFREQLAIKYPLYGHALWEPSPPDPDKPVQVGDVGFIRRGKFHRLFNTLLPASHLSHEHGVPDCHEPLIPNFSNHLDRGSLTRNHYCSTGVTMKPDPGYNSR